MWQKSISTFDPNENGVKQVVNGIEQVGEGGGGKPEEYVIEATFNPSNFTLTADVSFEDAVAAALAGKAIYITFEYPTKGDVKLPLTPYFIYDGGEVMALGLGSPFFISLSTDTAAIAVYGLGNPVSQTTLAWVVKQVDFYTD